MSIEIQQGDCREVLAGLEPDSFSACVTDPPYGIGFMGQAWDRFDADPVEASWSGKGRNHAAKRDPSASTPGGRSTSGTGFRKPNPRCGNCGRAINGRDTAKGFKVCHCPDPERIPTPNRDAQRFQAWAEEWSAEVYRVLKPGAYLLAFGGTRTYHRLACAIEDAGFEIRDTIMWLYGSGFPKSHDVSKAIDRAARGDLARLKISHFRQARGWSQEQLGRACGFADPAKTVWDWEDGGHNPGDANWQKARDALGVTDEEEMAFEREVIGTGQSGKTAIWSDGGMGDFDITSPATKAARAWAGWGTALKPACELICVARKPLSEPTVAANVLKHRTGALNIDASRVAGEAKGFWNGTGRHNGQFGGGGATSHERGPWEPTAAGRWPANVCHSGDEQVLAAFAKFGESGGNSGGPFVRNGGSALNCAVDGSLPRSTPVSIGDTGTAARFFFCAKADASERVTQNYEKVTLEWSHQRVELTVLVDQSPPRVIAVSGDAEACPQRWSTWLFGSGLMDLCQTASTCITSTKTSSTTALRIWNWLMRSLTSVSTAAASNGTMDGGNHAESAEGSTTSLTITVGKTASLPGAENVASKTQLRISVAELPSAGHPTIKPVALMSWLVGLVCPPGGRVLDPFAGTGSTLVACDRLGFDAVGIEQDPQTVADAHEKIRRMRARRAIGDVADKPRVLPGQVELAL